MQTATRTLATTELYQAGQSPWLDFISRELLASGKLKKLIDEKGVMGVTSNPSIFEKAIGSGSSIYDKEIKFRAKKGQSAFAIYDALSIEDIRKTCDLFLPLFKKTAGGHGFVSLEVTPDLAADAHKTLSEAQRLFKAVARPNVMIKIPATPQGITAIRKAIALGISVNVTLIFSMTQYKKVAEAYKAGLKEYKTKGGDVSAVYSVASVFVSRIDAYVDKKLDAIGGEALSWKGQAAVANSKLIYQEFKNIFLGADFQKLTKAGAHPQKVLWGSTSTKNPAYSDLLYVEHLVGPETVNTMPMNTLESLLDHGIVRHDTVEENLEQAAQLVSKLKEKALDLNEVGEILQKEGVKAFLDSFDSLMRTLESKRESATSIKAKSGFAKETYALAGSVQEAVENQIKSLSQWRFHERFFKADPTLWKNEDFHKASISNRMGWLEAHDWISGKLYEIESLDQDLKKEKIQDVVLLGMGGSSLAPEVLSLICKRKGARRFYMLDTTDPSSLLSVRKKLRLKSALFIVASKSGGTIETMSQFHYFYDLIKKGYGRKSDVQEKAGRHFVAITDPGSSLEKLARDKNFRKIFLNPANIGGRYSALSFFGFVPAVLMGIDVRPLLKSARLLFEKTKNETELSKNPAVFLGLALARLAFSGKDKLTLLASPKLESFGAWLEQLIAESTGKEGKGIIPVDTEDIQNADAYSGDRVFLVLQLKGEKINAKTALILKALKKSGAPIITSVWPSPEAIGAEFLKWEIATAVSGVALAINPFDEPNVKESKDNTAQFLENLKRDGKFKAFTQETDVRKAPVHEIFKKLKNTGYVSLLSFTERTSQVQKAYSKIRQIIQKRSGVPVLLGFGPRYLHSIGQLYKGGPAKGVFIVLLKQDQPDLDIPGAFYRFGQLKMAQALGDILALESKNLPVQVIQLGSDVLRGLKIYETRLAEKQN